MAAAPQELQDLLQASSSPLRDEAWSRFVARFSPLLLHTARSVARRHDAAMDAYAHLLEQLRIEECRRLRQYAEDPRSQFSTWLVVVARRLCLDHQRQRYGRFRSEQPADAAALASRRRLVDLIADEITGSDTIHDPGQSPDDQVRRQDLMTALNASLAIRTPAERLLLALRFEDDLPAREIARILRMPTPFHVYRALNSLLGELRLALGKRGVADAQP